MSNPSLTKGTKWAGDCAGYLKAHGYPNAERRVNYGSKDLGDLTGVDPLLVIEAKWLAKITLASIIDETITETRNVGDNAIGFAWVHRKGKASPGDGYWIMDPRSGLQLLAAWCGK